MSVMAATFPTMSNHTKRETGPLATQVNSVLGLSFELASERPSNYSTVLDFSYGILVPRTENPENG
jgi:hypothetical protein